LFQITRLVCKFLSLQTKSFLFATERSYPMGILGLIIFIAILGSLFGGHHHHHHFGFGGYWGSPFHGDFHHHRPGPPPHNMGMGGGPHGGRGGFGGGPGRF
jgi:hypothetical protein